MKIFSVAGVAVQINSQATDFRVLSILANSKEEAIGIAIEWMRQNYTNHYNHSVVAHEVSADYIAQAVATMNGADRREFDMAVIGYIAREAGRR